MAPTLAPASPIWQEGALKAAGQKEARLADVVKRAEADAAAARQRASALEQANVQSVDELA
eukprot:5860548-Prymnesium_polylepis.1